MDVCVLYIYTYIYNIGLDVCLRVCVCARVHMCFYMSVLCLCWCLSVLSILSVYLPEQNDAIVIHIKHKAQRTSYHATSYDVA